MSRIIAIGDIHGEFDKLKSLYNRIKFNPKTDTLVFLGDYIDRGHNPMKVVKFVQNLQKKYGDKVICLMGNHEDMAINYIRRGDHNWFGNGGRETVISYKNNVESMLGDIDWFESLPLYYETDKYIFVHGGINPLKSMEEQDREFMLWARDEYLYNPRKFPKKVISGHSPSQLYTNKAEAYKTTSGNIVIDTGAVFGGKLTACVINENTDKITFLSE